MKVPENNPCFNGRYELVDKYTTRGGNKHKKRTSYPYMTTAKSAQTYPSEELLPV